MALATTAVGHGEMNFIPGTLVKWRIVPYHHPMTPTRAVIVSAQMGEGHNAAADALTETIQNRWPGCIVERVDTMELRGTNFAQVARRAYELQLSFLPWSYAFFYRYLSRSAGFAETARKAVGALFGPHLARLVKAKSPDVVISTYPFGSAALDWVRSNTTTDVVSVTYIPAFHVHPLWVYRGIDLHFVMYDSAAEDARLSGFGRSMRLGAPPVRGGFGGIRREDARKHLGLAAKDFVVLVTGGAWGLGNIRAGVEALVKLGRPVHVVAVCGKNGNLEAALRSMVVSQAARLTVHGYVANMPELMAASDVVVTNGAGVTVLEALRTPRPVIAFAPLAGHGTASTAELVRRQLALAAQDVTELAAHVNRLVSQPELVLEMQRAGEEWGKDRNLGDSVDEIAAVCFERASAST